MNPLLNVAISAALSAGKIIVRSLDRLDTLRKIEKQKNDFVTEVDLQSEKEIMRILRKAYPDHAILAEESGRTEGDEHLWIIDPLDGTANFMHGFPHYSISIAHQYKNKLEVAVIYDPIRQEMFTALRGKGAHLNSNRRLRVNAQAGLEGSFLGTGFPYKHSDEVLRRNLV
jgi:myo-inositol-1(or 4)-monophosphatase